MLPAGLDILGRPEGENRIAHGLQPSQGTWWNYALRWRWKLGVELVVKIVLMQRLE